MANPTPVDPQDASKKNSDILGPTSDEATVQMSQMEQLCYWNGAEFANGDQVTSDGKKYECSFGSWIQIG